MITKNKIILIGLAVLISSSLYLINRNHHSESPSNIKYFSSDDQKVLQAKDEAQKQIDTLISIVKDNKCNVSYDCAVKKDFVENGKHEHMWIEVREFKDGVFYGILDDTPEVVSNIKYHDSTSANQLEVEDWSLHNRSNNTFQGNFLLNLIKH